MLRQYYISYSIFSLSGLLILLYTVSFTEERNAPYWTAGKEIPEEAQTAERRGADHLGKVSYIMNVFSLFVL